MWALFALLGCWQCVGSMSVGTLWSRVIVWYLQLLALCIVCKCWHYLVQGFWHRVCGSLLALGMTLKCMLAPCVSVHIGTRYDTVCCPGLVSEFVLRVVGSLCNP